MENIPLNLKENMISILKRKKDWHNKFIRNYNSISKEFASKVTKTLYKTNMEFKKPKSMLNYIQKK